MSRSFSRSSVLNANSFGSVCEAEDPIAWSVTHFYREVISPQSRLEPLLYADVTDVICYHQRGGVGHDFLIMCIRPRIGQEHFGERIWARCERHPGPVQGGPLRLSSASPPALDTIKLSFDRPKLKHESDQVIMESAFRNLQVLHVADLLRIIRSVSPTYGVASHNCWWFAAVAIGTLRVFGKDWTIQPSRDWVRAAIKALGRDTAKSSEEVTRLFVQAWNAGGQSEFIPLTSDQAWGDQRYGLVLHRQVQPPRAPTFPTPVAALRPIQGEPLPGRMGSLSSQYSAAPQPSTAARTLWSTQAIRSSPESGILPPVSEDPESFGQTSVLSQLQPPVAGTSALQLTTGNTPPPVYQELPTGMTDPVQSSSTSRRPSNASDMPPHTAIPPYHPHRGATYPYTQQDGVNPLFPDWPHPTVQTVPEEDEESSGGLPPGVPNGPQSSAGDLPSPTASNTWGPSHYYTPSVYSNGEERESLKELILRIIWNRNPGDVQVLLAVYPSFATSTDLLHELKSRFKGTPRDHEHAHIIRPRVVEILRQWVLSESWDPTLGSELQRLLARQVAVDPDFTASQDLALMLQKLGRPPDPSGSPSSPGGSLEIRRAPVGSMRGRRPTSGGRMPDSLAKMRNKDLSELARVLEAMELEFRFTLTIPRVVRWLAWTKGTQSSNSRVFSTLSDKIATWVLDSCLHGSIDTRATTYSHLLSLAEHCKQAGNLASVSDLLYGLRSSLITRLKLTLKLAGNVDDRLNTLIQSLHPRNPSRLLSLNARMQALVAPFGETSPEPGKISWTRCHLLYSELQKAVAVPMETPPPLVDPSYYSFVAVRMHSAWQNRAAHPNLSQQIAEDEPDQMRRWTGRAAGFNR